MLLDDHRRLPPHHQRLLRRCDGLLDAGRREQFRAFLAKCLPAERAQIARGMERYRRTAPVSRAA